MSNDPNRLDELEPTIDLTIFEEDSVEVVVEDPDPSEELPSIPVRGEAAAAYPVIDELVGRVAPRVAGGERAGTTVMGRFRLDTMIGRGGMAEVYKAWDRELDEWVAMKFLEPQASMKNAQRRFRREVQLLRTLVDPNVVRVYDFGVLDGRSWYSMELLEGTVLADLLKYDPPPLSDALPLLAGGFDGLAAVHERGVIHRDVKPDNLFVCDSPRQLKLLDFGVARAGVNRSELSEAGVALGTPWYMAPEVVMGKDETTAAADLYAMGVVVYEILTGWRPFEGRDLGSLMARIAREEAIPLRGYDERIPPEVDRLVMSLLRKEPERRPRDGRRIATQLRDLALLCS